MLEWFKEVFGWLPKEAFAALISMVPIIELRGGLPYAILSGVAPVVHRGQFSPHPLHFVVYHPHLQLDEANQTLPSRG